MQQRFFMAFCVGKNSNSGQKAERQQAVDWATEQMKKDPNISEVLILEGVAVVEREVPPVKVRELNTGQREMSLGERAA